MNAVKVKDVALGGESAPMVLIAGPCVIEDEKTTFETLEGILKVTEELGIPFIFKSSYDKANRTSIDSYRGPGIDEGLKVLGRVAEEFSVPILTDVHCKADCARVGEVVDCIQIPAFLCRQTDLLVAAASTGAAINIKKGQFMAPAAIEEAIRKVTSTGNESVFVTERGSSFGYNNLVVDYRALPAMRGFGYPVVFDATHSVQRPSAEGKSSGGDREMIPALAKAAVAVGVDGLFMEVHPDPAKALSDGPNSLALDDFAPLIKELWELDGFVKGL